MNLPWGSPELSAWVTNVGLITSDGPHGPNVMSAEWTHMISYKPALVAVCISERHATTANIRETKEFGVNLAANDQQVLASMAGNSSGANINKIELLKELGFTFRKAKTIDALMIDGAVLGLECKLREAEAKGDHIMCIGEVQHAHFEEQKDALGYHAGKYWKLSEQLPKPSDDERKHMEELKEKHTK